MRWGFVVGCSCLLACGSSRGLGGSSEAGTGSGTSGAESGETETSGETGDCVDDCPMPGDTVWKHETPGVVVRGIAANEAGVFVGGHADPEWGSAWLAYHAKSDGEPAWEFVGDPQFPAGIFDVRIDADGNAVVGGFPSEGPEPGRIASYGATGNQLWRTDVGEPSFTSSVWGVAIAYDGTVAAAGQDLYGPSLFAVSAAGEPQWTSMIDGPTALVGVAALSSAGYVVAGTGADLELVWVQESGQVLASETYDAGGVEEAFEIVGDAHGGVVVAASSRDMSNDSDALVMRIGADQGLDWVTRFDHGTYGRTHGVAVSEDGGVLAVGRSGSIDFANAWLTKLDADGNEEWSRSWGGDASEWADAVTQAPDGTIYVAGGRGEEPVDAWVRRVVP